jgi:TolA-binding protein
MAPNSTVEPPLNAFDPGLFWVMHRRAIVLGAAALIVAGLIIGGYSGFTAYQAQRAAEVYSKATSIDDWRAVVRQFPGTVAAGNASLRIAAQLGADGKLADSDAEYESFIRSNPKHPFLVNGYVGLAQNAETENKLDRALSYYTEAASQFPNSYAAPLALFNEARLTKLKGDSKAARGLFESVVQRFGNSMVASLARIEAEKLADQTIASKPAPSPSAQPSVSR